MTLVAYKFEISVTIKNITEECVKPVQCENLISDIQTRQIGI